MRAIAAFLIALLPGLSPAAPQAAPNALEAKLRANLDKGELILLRSQALRELVEMRKAFPQATFTWSRDSNIPTDLLVQGKQGDRTITLSFNSKTLPIIEKAEEAGNIGEQARRYQMDLCYAVRDILRAGFQHGFGGSYRPATPEQQGMLIWGPLEQSPAYLAMDAETQAGFAAQFQKMEQVVKPEEISSLAVWLHSLQTWLPKVDSSGRMTKLPKADSEFFFSATMTKAQAMMLDWASLDGMDASAFAASCDCQIFRLLDKEAVKPAADGSEGVHVWKDVQVLP